MTTKKPATKIVSICDECGRVGKCSEHPTAERVRLRVNAKTMAVIERLPKTAARIEAERLDAIWAKLTKKQALARFSRILTRIDQLDVKRDDKAKINRVFLQLDRELKAAGRDLKRRAKG